MEFAGATKNTGTRLDIAELRAHFNREDEKAVLSIYGRIPPRIPSLIYTWTTTEDKLLTLRSQRYAHTDFQVEKFNFRLRSHERVHLAFCDCQCFEAYHGSRFPAPLRTSSGYQE